MNDQKKLWTTGQIISAATGLLCCEMGDFYKILNFLTGDNLFTHQLPRAGRFCAPWVIQQHPWITDLDLSKCGPDTWRPWLNDAISKYGEVFELKPLPPGKWESQDLIEEAIEMFNDKSR